jgi:glycerol-3-phosphate dehydrogenase (NAD(P)+)
MASNPRAVVIGAGAFGTAIAQAIARGGRDVLLACRTAEQAERMRATRQNAAYFPGQRISDRIEVADVRDVGPHADIAFLAFPAVYMESYARICAERLRAGAVVVNLVKGLHSEYFTFADLFASVAPSVRYVALKGPTFARPLFNGELSGLTCGTGSTSARDEVAGLFDGVSVELDHCDSAQVVDALSAIKNVYAIVLGLIAAEGISENTTFLVISQVLKEVRAMLVRMGLDPDALFRYCGFGDLLLTGLCDTSRNRTLGIMVGKGLAVDTSSVGFLAEGVRVVTLLHARAGGHNTPLLNVLAAILAGRARHQDLIAALDRSCGGNQYVGKEDALATLGEVAS